MSALDDLRYHLDDLNASLGCIRCRCEDELDRLNDVPGPTGMRRPALLAVLHDDPPCTCGEGRARG